MAVYAGFGLGAVWFVAIRSEVSKALNRGLADRQLEILAVLAIAGWVRSSVLQLLLPEPYNLDDETVELRRTRQALSDLRSLGLVVRSGRGKRARWFLGGSLDASGHPD